MKNIFNRRKYTFIFQKACQYVSKEYHYEVTDKCILKVLQSLQNEYDFEIIAIQLRDASQQSKITIKCKKEDKNKICMAFSIKLGKKIENLSM